MIEVIHKHEARQCPVCSHRLTASGCMTEDTSEPKPGDFTICAYCAHPLVVLEDLKLRRAGRAELDQLDPDTLDALDRAVELAIARKVLAIAKAIEGMPRDRQCAVLSAACAQLGEYEFAEAFAREAARVKLATALFERSNDVE